MQDESIQSLGGKARADSLSAERRSEIASKAAAAKWALPVAHYEGELSLGKKEVPCAVVEIENQPVRIISSAGFMRALERPWKGSYKRTERPNFIQADNIKPFITNELESVLNLVEYRTPRGGVRSGYRAEMIPLVCEAYLSAKDAGDVLTKSQMPTARACELIMRGLARVGIMALVDEATGYQEVRDRMALARILEKYLMADGHRKWERFFQLDYYREIFRLNGWTFNPGSTARPVIISQMTNNVIYDRMQPGILKKLRELNPRTENGRKRKHHQFFTGDVGLPELEDHLKNVVFLMRAARTWPEFIDMIDRAKPRVGDTLKLNL